MRRRCLIHLATLLALRIVNRDATLPSLDKDNERDHNNRKCQDTQQNKNIKLTLPRLLERLADCLRQTGNDACEDQQRDAVADTLFRDLLAEPHHEDRAGHERRNCNYVKTEACVVSETLVREAYRHTGTLHECKTYG